MITCMVKVDEITEESEWLVLILSQGASTLIKAIERKGSIKGVRIVQHCDNQRSSFNVLLRNQRK